MIQQLSYISKDFIKQYLPKATIIVEAGAHKGKDTLEFKKFWPQTIIHAFEPVAELFQELKKKTETIPEIICHNFALNNKTAKAVIYQSSIECTAISSLLEPAIIKKEKPLVQFKEQTVQTITLDDWAKKNNVPHIDLLWLDVQGNELSVLKRAANILSTVKAIHTEASLVERYKDQGLYPELKQFLEEHGFRLVAEAFYQKTWGNILFVNNRLITI